MVKFFLKLYDAWVRRPWIPVLLAVILCGTFLFLSTRLHYEEDISKFLPANSENERYSEIYQALSQKNNVALLFSYVGSEPVDTVSRIAEAMDAFEVLWAGVDSTGLIPETALSVDPSQALGLADVLLEQVPFYLEEADYQRIDSLLNLPGYVRNTLQENRRMLLLPGSGVMQRTLRSDPLHLFSPVLTAFRNQAPTGGFTLLDGHLYTRDGKVGIGFMTSPFGGSETAGNARIAGMLEEAVSRMSAEWPDIDISAVGAPLIAVSNADRIKKDSLLAVSISLILIFLLLWLSFRRISDIFWIGASILFGGLFSLAAVSLLRDSISIIVLGVASVIIGIAVNYPLHFLDSLKGSHSVRASLREMVSPLLIGNITTVSAFLCLVWLDAAAMRDLGLFGGLMLVGTILFVLVFLPQFVRPRPSVSQRRVLEPGALLPDNEKTNPYVLAAFVAVTIVMGILGSKTAFDGDMSHINYMTSRQRAGMALLEEGLSASGGSELYAVVQGGTMEEAAALQEQLMARLAPLKESGEVLSVSGIGDLLPSTGRQREGAARWKEFWSGRSGKLLSELDQALAESGFSAQAFDPFKDLLGRDFSETDASGFAPLLQAFEGTSLLQTAEGVSIVNRVRVPDAHSEAAVKAAVGSRENAFAFAASDVGNSLVQVLSDSFNYIGFICSLVVFIFLWLSFRRLELSLLSFLPLAAGWLWILGTMHLLDIRFNIVNVILASFIFGQGDDYTIFMTEGLIYEHAYRKKRLSVYKNSVFLSAMLMFIGIGTLIFARHPAMRSLAEVTIVGMFMVVVMAWYLPPVIFRWITQKHGVERDIPLTLERIGYSLFALLAFLLIQFLVVYPHTFFHFLAGKPTEERKLRYHQYLQKMAGFLIRHVPGVAFSMENPSGEDFSKPAVVICNHQSHLDILCLMMLSPRLVFLTNSWVWRNPLYGYILRKAEYYPVEEGIENHVDKMAGYIRRGYSVVVFPEGTRTADGTIGRFHKGAFYLAEKLNVDLVTVFLHGAYHVLPKHDFMLRRGAIHVEVGGRYAPSDGYREMTKSYQSLYRSHYQELCRERETPGYITVYLRYKYLYKGSAVESACRRALAKEPAFLRRDVSGVQRVVIRHAGQGEWAWCFALMHPDIQVEARIPDEDSLLLARGMYGLPANLTFTAEETEGNGMPEMEVIA